MPHSPTLLMMQCHLCHLWLFQPPPCCLHPRPNLPPSVPANVVSRRRQPTPPHQSPPKSIPVITKAPAVSIVGPHAFAHLCNQPGVQLFTMSFAPAKQELSNANANANAMPTPTAQDDPDLSAVPPEYHEFRDLFSNAEAKKLPRTARTITL